MPEIKLSTTKKQEIVDITDSVQEIISKSKVKDGICNLFVLGATAAIIINENDDPNICLDLIDCLDKIAPQGVWRHDKVDSNASAHIKSAILGPSETVPITDGKLDLGTWQSIMLADFDGPRSERIVFVKVLGSQDS